MHNYKIKPIIKIEEDLTNIKKCINGHYLTESNIILQKHYGRMRIQCRQCKKIHDSQYDYVNGIYIRIKHIMQQRRGRGLLGGKNEPTLVIYHRQRKELLELMGNKCSKCEFDDPRALQIDHINGGGMKELRKLNTTAYFNKVRDSIINNLNEYQLLCANCNWIKRNINKENRR